MKLQLATAFIHIALTVVIASGCADSTDFSSQVESEPTRRSQTRHIPLDGQSNFRDLGGYAAADGRTVRFGQVYRSGELPRLSDRDVAQLDSLGIQTVVNFLTDSEIADRGEDRIPDAVTRVSLPMKAGNMEELTDIVLKARKTGDFTEVPPDFNPEIHRLLMDQGREYYAALLREISDTENRPLVFHCSHGVHRTGTAAAILLSALGVPWEVIREDYLLSNEVRKDEIEKRLDQLKQLDAQNRGIPLDAVDTTNLEAFYVLDGSYIDASLAAAVDEFGSMDNYIRKGLGLTVEEIERLRSELLEYTTIER
jgi:protein-tyrosine phosphatase